MGRRKNRERAKKGLFFRDGKLVTREELEQQKAKKEEENLQKKAKPLHELMGPFVRRADLLKRIPKEESEETTT